MSDDLISRKWLMKQFCISEDGRRIPEYDCDNFPITISIKDVKDIIRKAPTSFDKEKVIEKLQRRSHNYYPSIDHYCLSRKAVDLKDAIEIIEKGGIE